MTQKKKYVILFLEGDFGKQNAQQKDDHAVITGQYEPEAEMVQLQSICC